MRRVQSGFLSSDLGLRCFPFSKESLQSIPRARVTRSHPAAAGRRVSALQGPAMVLETHGQPLGSAEPQLLGAAGLWSVPLPRIAFAYGFAGRRCSHSNDFIINGAAQARRGSPSSEPWGSGGRGGSLVTCNKIGGSSEQERGRRRMCDVQRGRKPWLPW